uniref:Endo/exonuclease/phosphatase domain-containing protein n=1 Tax=Glossina austeni TaxID=7395 RepID=A0A1A9VIF2_GLOAU
MNGETLTVTALYQKPKEGLFSNDLDQLENVNAEGEILMAADLNAKHIAWGGNEINMKGRRLYNWITNSPNIDIIPTIEPSRITSTTSSYIDFFIASTSISAVQYFALNETGLKTLDFNADQKELNLILSNKVDKIVFCENDNITDVSLNTSVKSNESSNTHSTDNGIDDSFHINVKKDTLEQDRQDIIDVLVNNTKTNIIAAEKGLHGEIFIQDGVIHRLFVYKNFEIDCTYNQIFNYTIDKNIIHIDCNSMEYHSLLAKESESSDITKNWVDTISIERDEFA